MRLRDILWNSWRTYTGTVARYQSALLLSAVYVMILGPSALLARAFGRHLIDLSKEPRESYWTPITATAETVAGLKRQF